ncbi:integral membrane [Fusarium albosuccineum]|uniref:Integral membrane n=1 Tax=Fusarium albosuccineum TaxID=1237068 RepID=A0A8H4LG72_9HYPO|nr:integral membrane [Fusarium albosuccineum]
MATIFLAAVIGLQIEGKYSGLLWAFPLLTSLPIGTKLGFGRHLWNVPVTNIAAILQMFYSIQILYILVQVSAKASLLAFYSRVFTDRKFRIAVWVAYVFLFGHGIIFLGLVTFHCIPVHSIWDRSVDGKCIDLTAIAYAGGVLSIIEDIAIFILPIPELMKLQLQGKKKTALFFMFSIGSFACVTSIVRLKYLGSFSDPVDPTWHNVYVVIWSTIELSCALICASLPALRPLVQMVPGVLSTVKGSSFKKTTDESIYEHAHPRPTVKPDIESSKFKELPDLPYFIGSENFGSKSLKRCDYHIDLIDEMRAKKNMVLTPKRLSEETMDADLEWLVGERIQPWLQSCLTGTGLHAKCGQRKLKDDQNLALPTRLIEVGGISSSTVRLVKSNEVSWSQERPHYLALSYVWGQGNEPAKTTRANIKERLRKININILPKTIQDAIKLARFMKVEYLWVDAVCIIQSCPEDNYLDDWKLEAPNMGSYYSSAYCLVSALSATDSSEGLFTERQIATYPTKSCTIAFDQDEEEYRYLPPLKISDQLEFSSAPLMKRGWCLQERLLSCRMLHWSKHCLFWECPGLLRRSELLRPIPRDVNIPENIKFADVFEQSSAEAALGKSWLNVVFQYIRCISVESFSETPGMIDFSQQTNRVLRLEAPLVWMELAAMTTGWNHYRSKRWNLKVELEFDTRELQPDSLSRVCVLILGVAVKKSYHMTGLVLKPNDRFYERVGLAFIDVRTKDWLHIFTSDELTPEINEVVDDFNDLRCEIDLI